MGGSTSGVIESATAPFSTSGAPSGNAGGDLNGTYPNPNVSTFNSGTPFGSAAALASTAIVLGGKLTASAQTGNFTLTLPANAVIASIFFQETAGHPILGGLRIGTTSGAADVVTALTVNASALGTVATASILKTVFSTSATQTLFLQAVTGWNGASINLEIIYYSL